MNRNASYWRLLFTLTIVGILLSAASREVLAQQNPDIVPPHQAVGGMTYSQWSAAWWQWLLAIPFGKGLPSPTFYSTGKDCGTNQSGPVWYLTGPAAGSVGGVTEKCTVPAGKYIFIPILNAECSTYEAPDGVYPSSKTGPGCTDEGTCKACAKSLADLIAPSSLIASVDGIPVSDLQTASSPFRVQSPFFQFSVPTENFFATDSPPLSGSGSGMSVSDGYWLMIMPLPPGPHTIHVQGNFVLNGTVLFGENVTYNVTVAQP